MANGRELSHSESWEEFKMHHDGLELPTAQQILAGMALLEIQSEFTPQHW